MIGAQPFRPCGTPNSGLGRGLYGGFEYTPKRSWECHTRIKTSHYKIEQCAMALPIEKPTALHRYDGPAAPLVACRFGRGALSDFERDTLRILVTILGHMGIMRTPCGVP